MSGCSAGWMKVLELDVNISELERNMNQLFILLLLCSLAFVSCQSSFPCPEPSDITPCTCVLNDITLLMTLDCSAVTSTRELELVFSAKFPFLHYGEFKMVNDPATPSAVDDLPDGLFGNLTFDSILIQNAMIFTLGPNIFEKSYSNMEMIVIEGTQLTSFPFDHLSSFTTIISINLANNKLTNMADLNSGTLSYLNVAGNLNLFFSGTDFVNAPNLVFINLENTGQQVIPRDIFVDLYKIELINLNKNRLTILETNSLVFPGSSVNFLDLSNNLIFDVQAGAIQGINKAASLYFVNNAISILHEGIWRPLFEEVAQTSTTGQIFLEGNPLDCSCSIAWLVTNETLIAEISQTSACANGGPNIVELNPSFYDINC